MHRSFVSSSSLMMYRSSASVLGACSYARTHQYIHANTQVHARKNSRMHARMRTHARTHTFTHKTRCRIDDGPTPNSACRCLQRPIHDNLESTQSGGISRRKKSEKKGVRIQFPFVNRDRVSVVKKITITKGGPRKSRLTIPSHK